MGPCRTESLIRATYPAKNGLCGSVFDASREEAPQRELAEAVQEATGESVELAYVDQGLPGEEPVGAQRRSTAFAWR